jgi:endonuclease YncB( thermonuclease family)
MLRIKKRQISVVLLILALPISALSNTGVVKKVLSGDRVQIGDTFIARLTGITVPPRDETFGYKIYDFTKRELEGKTVKLFTWTTDNTAAGIVHDKNGYPFVEIEYWKGESLSFNEVLLKKGYARVDQKYLPENLNHYLDLEKEAREKGLGIWEKKDHREEPACHLPQEL